MTTVAVVAVFLLLATSEAQAEAPTTSGASACPLPRKATQFAVDRYMRVYRRRPDDPVVACVFATGLDELLDSPGEGYAFLPPALRLRGPLIALGVDVGPSLGPSDDSDLKWRTFINVVDVRKSPERFVRRTGPNRLLKIGSLALSASGTLAWIVCPEPERAAPVADPRPTCTAPGFKDYVYRQRASERRPHRLDAERQIDPASLRADGDQVMWRVGERVKRASFR